MILRTPFPRLERAKDTLPDRTGQVWDLGGAVVLVLECRGWIRCVVLDDANGVYDGGELVDYYSHNFDGDHPDHVRIA